MLKIKNIVKSNESKQVNNVASVTSNSGTYVKIDVPSHTQYNNDVLMLNYQKDTKYQKYTINNIALLSAIDETLVNTSFVTIGEEPIIGHCITTQDLINIYANGCIQGFYEEYCKLHSHKENVILAKLLSILGIEIWRNVECYGGIYKGKYMVSNLGNVKSLPKTKQAKILKQYDNSHGYLFVRLSQKNQAQNVRVNRLVALTFIGESNEQLEVCHSNTNSYDNRLFNLDFKTHLENIRNPITQKKAKETLKTKATESTTAPTLE